MKSRTRTGGEGEQAYVLTREDKLSLAFHLKAAEKLRLTPDPVIAKARANAERFAILHPHLSSHFTRWEDWLSLPLDDLCALMTSETEDSVWMRHITVFAGVLSPDERNEIIRQRRAAQT